MNKIYISVLLVILAISSYSNARRMLNDQTAVTDFHDLLMLASCSHGNHWVDGYYSGSGYNRHYVSGYCADNSSDCKKFDKGTRNCTKCNWGYELIKDQRQGHHCKMTWWMVLLIVLGSIAGLFLGVFLIMCLCSCCGCKGKRHSISSSSSSSSSRSSGLRLSDYGDTAFM